MRDKCQGDNKMAGPTIHADIELAAGDSWNISGTVLDLDGSPLDLSAAAIEWILIGPDGLVAASFPGVAEDVTDLPAGRYVDALRVTTVKNGRQTVWRGCVLVDTAPPPVPLPPVVPPSPISIAIGGLAIGAPGFVLAQYHQGQTTVPRLLALLRGFGIDISKRELVRLLTTGHDSFHEEAREQPPKSKTRH
jgi:hypothetical protein